MKVAPWLPKFGLLGSLESLKDAFFRTLFSPKLILESWIWHCLWESYPKYPLDITMGTLIIVYFILQDFSWFKNYKLYWVPNLFLAPLLLVTIQKVFVLTRIYCLWWRWWARVTHAPNFFTRNQDFTIEFGKSVIDLKRS